MILAIHSCNDTEQKCCECLSAEGKSDAYVYPLTPESPSWDELETGEEMYKACLIPSDQLEKMCTEGILESWLTYPLRLNVFAWPTPQAGIEGIEKQFNGLKEFYTRPDAGMVAFNRYKYLDLSAYDTSASSVSQGKFAITVAVLELTIAQEEVLKAMSSHERNQLVQEALSKRIKKENDPLYPPLANAYDVLIMGRIMILENFLAFKNIVDNDVEIRHFVESGEYIFITGDPDPSRDLNTIVAAAQGFIRP